MPEAYNRRCLAYNPNPGAACFLTNGRLQRAVPIQQAAFGSFVPGSHCYTPLQMDIRPGSGARDPRATSTWTLTIGSMSRMLLLFVATTYLMAQAIGRVL